MELLCLCSEGRLQIKCVLEEEADNKTTSIYINDRDKLWAEFVKAGSDDNSKSISDTSTTTDDKNACS